eukprot:scaffold77430_cov66-Phaeocystis_antarctica.AAC.5
MVWSHIRNSALFSTGLVALAQFSAFQYWSGRTCAIQRFSACAEYPRCTPSAQFLHGRRRVRAAKPGELAPARPGG